MAVEKMIYNFGAGRVWLDDKEVGDLRDVQVEYTRETKEYRGARAHVQDSAIVNESYTFKASSGGHDAALVAAALGATVTTGSRRIATETHDTAPGTAVLTNSATWIENLEVTHPTYGRMVKVPSAPALGQYSVAAGTVTYNASEVGNATVSYRYTSVTGTNAIVSSLDKRQAPRVRILCWLGYHPTQPAGMEMFAAVLTKWNIGTKQEDYLDPSSVEGFAVADSTGQLVRFDQA